MIPTTSARSAVVNMSKTLLRGRGALGFATKNFRTTTRRTIATTIRSRLEEGSVVRHRPFVASSPIRRSAVSSSTTAHPAPPSSSDSTPDADSSESRSIFDSDAQTLRDVIAELKAQGVDVDNIRRTVSEGDREEPWKKLLGVPARAAWRVAPAPSPIQPSIKHVFETAATKRMKTRKQLKQIFRTVLQQHQKLADRRERERLRWINRRPYTAPERQADQGLLPVAYGPAECLSYVYFRAVPQYAVVRRILRECRSLLQHDTSFRPQRVLDFGAGCGTASAAALHVFGDSVEWVHGIDCSHTMRQTAQLLLEHVIAENNKQQEDEQNQEVQESPNSTINTPIVRTTFAAHLSEQGAAATHNTFDLALLSYTASEFTHNAATVAAAAALFEKLRPGGLLVMVEPGTPDGFNSIRTVRNMLLDCCPPNAVDAADGDDECHIVAPCTHHGRCPMERLHYHKHLHAPRPTHQDVAVATTTTTTTPDDNGKATATAETTVSTADADSDDDEEDEDVGAYDYDDDDGIMSKGFCSFVQTMPSSHNGTGEKFSYLVAQKRITGERQQQQRHDDDGGGGGDNNNSSEQPHHRFDDINLRDLLEHTGAAVFQVEGEWHEPPEVLHQRAVELERQFLENNDHDDDLGLDFVQGDQNRHSFGRIVHAPLKKKGHVLMDTCIGPHGKIVRHKVNKALSKAFPGIYSAARKSRWGGYWPIVEELQEENVYRRKRTPKNK